MFLLVECLLNKKSKILVYGHSFPAQLRRKVESSGRPMEEWFSLSPDQVVIKVAGHPGLTF